MFEGVLCTACTSVGVYEPNAGRGGVEGPDFCPFEVG